MPISWYPPWQDPHCSCHGAQVFWWINLHPQLRSPKHIMRVTKHSGSFGSLLWSVFSICHWTGSPFQPKSVGTVGCQQISPRWFCSCSYTTTHLRWITQGMASAITEKRAWRFTCPTSSKRCDYCPWNSLSIPIYPLYSVLSWTVRLLNPETLRFPHNLLSKRFISIFLSQRLPSTLMYCLIW